MEKQPLIAVVGPTASGKSGLAIALAKWLDGEVVSADSMQVYREMQIGTARPTEEEMDGVPHHLLGMVSVETPFSVADYVPLAQSVIAEIAGRGKMPILCGGTGLYVRSLLHNVQFAKETRDEGVRLELYQRLEQFGSAPLVAELEERDPVAARKIDHKNISRVIRALEVCIATGSTFTEEQEKAMAMPSPYDVCLLGITFTNRQTLYDRIHRRVDNMLEQGLLDEVQRIFTTTNGQTAMQAIGYKEFAPYLTGMGDFACAVEELKQSTRRYAKRQLTWFRKEEGLQWLTADAGEESLLEQAKEKIAEKFGERGKQT